MELVNEAKSAVIGKTCMNSTVAEKSAGPGLKTPCFELKESFKGLFRAQTLN